MKRKRMVRARKLLLVLRLKRRVWDLITIGKKKFSLSVSSKSALHLHLMYIIIRELFFTSNRLKKISYKEVERGLCGG